jgi:hypothetical protein
VYKLIFLAISGGKGKENIKNPKQIFEDYCTILPIPQWLLKKNSTKKKSGT